MKRVLVADDHSLGLEMLTMTIDAEGGEDVLVEPCNDGNEAMAMLETHDKNPFRMVLTDYQMPGYNGVEVATEAVRRGVELVYINTDVNPVLVRQDPAYLKNADMLKRVQILRKLQSPEDFDKIMDALRALKA